MESSTYACSPSMVFICMPSYLNHSDANDTYVTFQIKCIFQPANWSVNRRYSNFHELFQAMNRIKGVAAELKTIFPPKALFALTPPELDNRRVMLEAWLRDATSMSMVNSNSVLRNVLAAFLQIPTSAEVSVMKSAQNLNILPSLSESKDAQSPLTSSAKPKQSSQPARPVSMAKQSQNNPFADSAAGSGSKAQNTKTYDNPFETSPNSSQQVTPVADPTGPVAYRPPPPPPRGTDNDDEMGAFRISSRYKK